ncbi:hypothetical protein [Deinococcus hopiensis]|uniref:hypothetical protein n=1 Tax=Deinococcus hopiensis TaxID=309885 RepID=UPI00111C79DB|nr:hypothetical protein [Deinococcus hopiensis]
MSYTNAIKKVTLPHPGPDFSNCSPSWQTGKAAPKRSDPWAIPALEQTRFSVPTAKMGWLKDQRHQRQGAPTLLSDAERLLLAQTIRHRHRRCLEWGARVQSWRQQELGKDLHLRRRCDVPETPSKKVFPEVVQATQAGLEGAERRVEVC